MDISLAIAKLQQIENLVHLLEDETPMLWDVRLNSTKIDEPYMCGSQIFYELRGSNKDDEHLNRFSMDFDTLDEMEVYIRALINGARLAKWQEV